MIRLSVFPPFHRFAESAGCLFVLRDENDSTRFAVESIDQGKLASGLQFVDAERLKTAKQGGWIPRNGRMHHQMGRFVDEKKVVVLVDDLEFGRVEAQVDLESYS